MKNFFKEFKVFAMRGNMMDLAVGMMIGSAFTAIVSSLVDDMLSPLIGIFVKADFSELAVSIGGVDLRYGAFIMAILNFLIVAVVLFCIVKALNGGMKAVKKEEEKPEAAPTTKVCPYCQSEVAIAATRCPHCTSMLEE